MITGHLRFGRDDSPSSDTNNNNNKLEQCDISSAIYNGEDIGPFIRNTFSSGKTDTLLQHLCHFTKSKELEIEDVCRIHYQDFILVVDELKSLVSDVDSLKSSLSNSNSELQSVAGPLLTALDAFVEAQNISHNVGISIDYVQICVKVIELCSRTNFHLSGNNFYMTLKCVDALEREFIEKTPSSTIRNMLEKQIPEIRAHIEKRISKEFGDWLVDIRTVSRNLGQLAIGQASAARQREEELRIKQRQAKEQSRLSLRDCVYALIEEWSEERELLLFSETKVAA